MGIYLNPDNDNFNKFVKTGTYVDKTGLIKELNLLIDNPARDFVCVSRPPSLWKNSCRRICLPPIIQKGLIQENFLNRIKLQNQKVVSVGRKHCRIKA